MVRSNIPISEIRSFAQKRGDYLISHHAVEKIKNFICTPKDVYENVLVEDIKIEGLKPEKTAPVTAPPEIRTTDRESILIVEGEKRTQKVKKVKKYICRRIRPWQIGRSRPADPLPQDMTDFLEIIARKLHVKRDKWKCRIC